LNGSNWEYFTAYPTFVSTAADSGTQYRVVVASTAANISDPNCSFADATSILTLNVNDCGGPLNTNFISFSSKTEENRIKLNWTTSQEEEQIHYVVERSLNGTNFSSIATINSHSNKSEANYYGWEETYQGQTIFYRIKMVATGGKQKISRIIKVSSTEIPEALTVTNPFSDKLTARITTSQTQLVRLNLIDNTGRTVRSQQFVLVNGENNLQLNNTGNLQKGLYTIQVQYNATTVVNKKIIKQ
jgi:hypothetical protein